MSEPFTREIRILPGFDHRDKPGGTGQDVMLVLVVRGSAGAVSFEIHTGWMARPIQGQIAGRPRPLLRHDRPGLDDSTREIFPIAGSIVIHSPEPRDGAKRMDRCGLVSQRGLAPCWTELATMHQSALLFNMLVSGGSDAALDYLRSFYELNFEQPPADTVPDPR